MYNRIFSNNENKMNSKRSSDIKFNVDKDICYTLTTIKW